MSGDLVVRVVGTFAVVRAGRELPAVEVGSRKARTLLALLAVSGGHVPVDRIVAALWRYVPPRDPAPNVATLVSRLRARFGAGVVGKSCAGYRLGVGVRVDLRDAAGRVAEAESRLTAGEPGRALRFARRAASLLDGEVLAGADAPWAEPARAWHQGLLRRSRHTMGEAALRVGDFRIALLAGEAAVAADALDEAAYRILMRAYQVADEPARALPVYRRLCAALDSELGAGPARSTRDLHAAILRATAVQA